eukprot:9923-Heterococcus_DN1.PRE.1
MSNVQLVYCSTTCNTQQREARYNAARCPSSLISYCYYIATCAARTASVLLLPPLQLQYSSTTDKLSLQLPLPVQCGYSN